MHRGKLTDRELDAQLAAMDRQQQLDNWIGITVSNMGLVANERQRQFVPVGCEVGVTSLPFPLRPVRVMLAGNRTTRVVHFRPALVHHPVVLRRGRFFDWYPQSRLRVGFWMSTPKAYPHRMPVRTEIAKCANPERSR